VVYDSGIDEQNIETAESLVNGLRDRRLTRDIAGVGESRAHRRQVRRVPSE